jgi:hypothetical protein
MGEPQHLAISGFLTCARGTSSVAASRSSPESAWPFRRTSFPLFARPRRFLSFVEYVFYTSQAFSRIG